MADKRVTVTIEAVDKASSTIKSVSQQLQSLGKISGLSGLSKLGSTISSIGNAFSSIKGKASLAVAGISLAVNGFNKLYTASKQNFIEGLSKIGNVCKIILSGIVNVGKSFLSLAGSVANADLSFSGLVTTAMNYDQTLERIGIKANASESELSALGSTIKTLTTDTVYSMDEIAGAAEYMVQNGRTATQVVNELSAVTGLATVGNLDLSKSADIVASTMNMFSRQGLTASQVANVLAKAANSSGANVENLAKSLENCGPQAAALNIGFEEVVATLAIMGDNAIKGGKAGTALKNILSRMAAPTKAVSEAISKYNLETAQAKIVSGDLKGGLLELQKQLMNNNVSTKDQQAAIKDLAGAYGAAGLTAVLSTATDELMVTFEAMEKGLVTTDDLSKGMETLMSTIQGQVMRFSANVQLAFYNLYTQANSSIAKVMDVLNDFMSNLNSGMSLAGALKNLENDCTKIPQILSNAISNAIKGIDSFINGGALDSILNIGSNIVRGITSGIDKAYNSGTLTSAISGLIGKICDWISTNFPLIEKAGLQIVDAIKQGIENNKGKISNAMNAITSLLNSWANASGELQALFGNFANILIDAFITNMINRIKNKTSEVTNAIKSMVNAGNEQSIYERYGIVGENSGTKFGEGKQKGSDGTPLKLNEANFTELYNQYGNHGLTGGQNYGTKVNEGIESTKSEIIAKGSEVGTGTAQAIEDGLNSMNTTQLTELKNAIDEVGQVTTSTASTMSKAFTSIANSARTSFTSFTNIVRNQMVNSANIVRNQCVNMANIFRNQFVSMANVARTQMVNVSNIIRNQAVSWSNVIRNQVQNARNALTSSFLSMAAVARTQMINISNIIRNQAISWSNIIRNQAANARNALTSSFMSMAAVARTQMAKVLSTVRSYMSQIAAACNKTLTLKVNISKTETTTKKVVVENSSLGLSMPQTSSLSASSEGTRASATTTGLGSLVGALSATNGGNRAISIEVPLVLEGREIARASAVYTRDELAKLEKRSNRKRGE